MRRKIARQLRRLRTTAFFCTSRRVKFKFVRIMWATDGAVLSGKRGEWATPRARCLSRIRNYSAIKKRLFCIDEDVGVKSHHAAPRVTKNLRPNNILTSLVIRFPCARNLPPFRPRTRFRGRRGWEEKDTLHIRYSFSSNVILETISGEI